jgi:tRNA dimethylallyltransferase
MQQADEPIATITLSLEPLERALLHNRIAARFDQMLELGLLKEVAALHNRGDLHLDLPSMRCVGYRQLWSVLENEMDLRQAREQAISATRQLAKRQITWLRSQPDRRIVDACSPNATSQVINVIHELWGAPNG